MGEGIHGPGGAYPRSRGGTGAPQVVEIGELGLSPLARGNLGETPNPGLETGPIPARAGEPLIDKLFLTGVGAYPRSRGGTDYRVPNEPSEWGLSPLARGNRSVGSSWPRCSRPIPARAGEPTPVAGKMLAEGAYPRSRGGTDLHLGQKQPRGGLSPLARGNQSSGHKSFEGSGPIPARAGEPGEGGCAGLGLRAYPRSRGGTSHTQLVEV